ncbi:hypothetical protein ACFE04_007550 [Oxalis oulophora]
MDRISEFPDDILAIIISPLTLKEAVTTSVLSTRWIDLWKHYTGCFVFDGSPIRDDFRKQYHNGRRGVDFINVDDKVRDKFIDSVDQVLQSHKVSTMKQLKDFTYFNPFPGAFKFLLPLYEFPSPCHCRRFRSLTTLSLTYVGISGQTLESLINDCPNLEELYLTRSKTLRSFKFYSLSLKHFTLCYCGDFKTVADYNISAPNLLSFTYMPLDEVNLVLQDTLQLNYLNIREHWCNFQNHLSQLLEFVWHYSGSDYYYERPELPNLKILTMKNFDSYRYFFSAFVADLQAAPLLEHLTLEAST